MKNLLRTILMITLSASCAAAVPALSDVTVGNVSTSGFCVCWQTSELSNPVLEVFADQAETQPLTGQVRIEYFPLNSDQRGVASSVSSRAAGRDLRDSMRSRNVVLVKVSGLDPDTTYYLRPAAVDQNDQVIATAELTEATTARTAVFVNESRRVLVDVAALEVPGSSIAGGLIVVETSTARYPLISVIGDAADSTQAYVDLTHFLTADGATNLIPNGVTELDIRWKGLPEAPGGFENNEIPYGAGTTVAETSVVDFVPDDQKVNFTLILRKNPPVVGLPQNVLLSAEKNGGADPDYDRPAVFGSTGTLLVGGGATAPFQDGILSEHPVVFGSPGEQTISIKDPVGTSVAEYPVTVLPLTYENWRNYYWDANDPDATPDADPDKDGLRNDAEFATLRNPLRRDGDVLSVARTAGGLKAFIKISNLQSEYVLAYETSNDLSNWTRSDVTPTVSETLPSFNLMEAFFPSASFGDKPFGAVRAILLPAE